MKALSGTPLFSALVPRLLEQRVGGSCPLRLHTARRPNTCVFKKSTAKQIVELAGAALVEIKVFPRMALIYFRGPNSAKVLCVAEHDLSIATIQRKLHEAL